MDGGVEEEGVVEGCAVAGFFVGDGLEARGERLVPLDGE
jgi:hypothetical protein